jgi:hypothetical protein
METNFDCVIGIDPGKSGGIAVCAPGSLTKTVKMPKDIIDLCEYMRYLQGIHKKPVAFMEKVQMFHQDSEGERGGASYGKQFGIGKLLEQSKEIKNALKIIGIPYILVHPMTWQAYLHLRKQGENDKIQRKNRYKDAAQNMFQDVKVNLWNSDALLLAKFGMLRLERDPEWIVENLPAQISKTFKF